VQYLIEALFLTALLGGAIIIYSVFKKAVTETIKHLKGN